MRTYPYATVRLPKAEAHKFSIHTIRSVHLHSWSAQDCAREQNQKYPPPPGGGAVVAIGPGEYSNGQTVFKFHITHHLVED